MATNKRVCSVCKDKEDLRGHGEKELRPYGKGGALICYSCAMKPENREDVDARFAKMLGAAEKKSPYVELTRNGPKPVKLGQ